MPPVDDKTAQRLLEADQEVERLKAEYEAAVKRRRQVFQRVAKRYSRQSIAETIGKSVTRVQQIVGRTSPS